MRLADGPVEAFDLVDPTFYPSDGLPDSASLNLDRGPSPSIHHDDIGPKLFESPPRLFLANMIPYEIAYFKIPTCISDDVRIVLQLKETHVTMVRLHRFLLQAH